MKLWYLAHPVAPCERYTLQQNLAHTMKVARIAWDAGFRTIMPWFAHCHFLDDSNPEHRSHGLECDTEVIRHLRRIIYSGDRYSKGMEFERQYARGIGCESIDAVGIADRELRDYFKSAAELHL